MGAVQSLSSDAQAKIYRQLVASYEDLAANDVPQDQRNERLWQLHKEVTSLYSLQSFKCPHVRFGRTELSMPIITCGGMRLQQSWNPPADLTLETIDKDCQKNVEAILDRSMSLGINHFETARGYGSSEMQFGPLLKKYPRDSYILQSKVVPKASQEEFRTLLEKTFKELQLDDSQGYLDLFSFHGINKFVSP